MNSLSQEKFSLSQDIEKLNLKVKNLNIDLSESEEIRKNLKFDINELNERIIDFEEELYESKNIQLDLLDQLKEMENRNELLEDKIQELLNINEMLEKNQAVYIAKKNDKVDKTLANYLNRYPEREKMNIMFLRESEGVYQFGQKRVYVKVEKGDTILVRVGGGYMHIDEFIRQYTPQEVEKIERKDVLARFSNKLAVQNISNQANAARENSPIRSPQRARSPGYTRWNLI